MNARNPPVMFRGPAIFLLLALPFLASCQRESQVAKATREGILIIGNSNEPKGLDPHVVSGVLESNILRALFEGLVHFHPSDDTAAPGGAASELTPDETYTIWTAKLRPEAKWSDGATVTAHDFAFAYERMLTPALGAKYADMLHFLEGAEAFNRGETDDFSTVGVEVIDDFTLRLKLRGPTPYFPELLKHYTWCPVPRHVVLRHGGIGDRGNPWTRPENIVGNGSFQMKSWRFNHHIEVERNPRYWNAANVSLNGIRFLPVNNSYTEARMFRNGQLHLTYSSPPEVVDFFKEHNPSLLRQEPYTGTYFYRCNVTRAPLDDARVRQALNFAIDRAAICDNVFRGYVPAHAISPPMGDYQPPEIASFDPEKARALLAEAGYPEGRGFPRIKLLIASREVAATLAQAIQAMWRQHLGIEVEIENKEWTAYLVAMQQLDYDIASAGWIGDYLDPLTFIELWATGGGNNNTGWASQPFMEKLQQSFQATDPAERFRLLHDAEAIVLEEAPILPIGWFAKNYLLDPNVEGWHPLLLDNHPYQFVRLRGQQTRN